MKQGHEVHTVTGPPHPLPMKGVVQHRIPNNGYYVKKWGEAINPSSPFDIFKPVNFYEFLHTRLGAFSEISSFSYRAFSFVRDLHRKTGFDIIHDNQCLGYGLLLMKQLGIPVTATIHHPLSVDLENVLERVSTFRKKLKTVMFYPTLMQSIVSKRLDGIITVSEDSKKRITSDFGVPPEKQSVVYNGIDTEIFRPIDEIKKIPGKILFVGNVEDGKKGFVYLLKAMKNIDRRLKLTVVDGGSPHRNITGVLMKKYNLYDRVEFTGKVSVDELVRHYNESILSLTPSVYEGFGFPAGESMACGTPVISSDGGALPEVVGDAGIIIPVRNSDAVSEAVNSLAFDQKRLDRYRDAGLERITSLFRWDYAVERMVSCFRKASGVF